MIRVFVDPASRSAGYAVYDDEKLIESGTLLAVGDDEVERMVQLWAGFKKVAERIKPEELYVERMNYQVHYLVQWAVGIVKTVFAIYGGTKVHGDVSPNSWKAFLKREALTLGGIKAMNDTSSDDEAVAIGLGLWFFDKRKREEEAA